jgi:hypothetical protein
MDDKKSLPVIQAKKVDADILNFFRLLNSSIQLSSADNYEESEVTDESVKSWTWGELPFYQCFFSYEMAGYHTNIYYYLDDYNYLNSIFDIQSEWELLTNNSLDFESPDRVEEKVCDLLIQVGVSASERTCLAMSQEVLQNFYDEKVENGTLRDVMWGEDGSRKKNRSAICEKKEWTKADECYYLEFSQNIDNISVNNSQITALVNKEGLIYLDMEHCLINYSEEEEKELLDTESIIKILNQIGNSIYKNSCISLEDVNLYYYCVDSKNGIYQPVWKASYQYNYKDGDGSLQSTKAIVLINAYTGEQIRNE